MSPTARMPQQLRAAKRRLASISIKNDRPKFSAWPKKRVNPTLLPFSRLRLVRCLSANKPIMSLAFEIMAQR
jgi:hypothetical protein